MNFKSAYRLLRPLGALRYILLIGVSTVGGWMFVVSCFMEKVDGQELTFAKLIGNLVVAVATGALWGAAMWKSSESTKSTDE